MYNEVACSEGKSFVRNDRLDKAQVEIPDLIQPFCVYYDMLGVMAVDLLKDEIRPMYFKYLTAAFGGALISSIYGIVDMAMVGQYQGPLGIAAMAIIAPFWNIIYSLGLLMGIGGSVLFSTLRGKYPRHQSYANEFFTVALLSTAVISLLLWLGIIFYDRELLLLFGADDVLLPLAQSYLFPVKFVVPCFLFLQLMSAFLRNDGNPALATKAVLCGGIFNVFGDYFFVFTLDMGIMGAGLATALGAVLSLSVMLSHFFSERNTLTLPRPTFIASKLKFILATGFATFFVDVAMGILTLLFNRQIITYLNTDALAVYGVIINISTFVQCCAYSIGQASQPLLSINYGAGQGSRIKELLKYALATAVGFGLFWTALSFAVPQLFVRIFMQPTASILQIAPAIIRDYGVSFLLLPFNIFSTYYFQALMRNKTSFMVSVGRGAVISGLLIWVLPQIFPPGSIWQAMPITEGLTAVYVITMMRKYTQNLKG